MLGVVIILGLAAVGIAGYFWWKNQSVETVDDVNTRVNLMVAVPQNKNAKKESGQAEDLKAIIGPMETIFSNLTAVNEVIGSRHLTFEVATEQGLITFYASVPYELVDFLEKQITSQYPDALVERAP